VIALSDDTGRSIELAHAARRIISLVPSVTEALFALGGGDAVIGVTRYCTEPAAALARVERVGGTKNPDVQRIIALRPDLVLLNTEENRKEDYDALIAADLPTFVSFPRQARDTAGLLHRLGVLTGTAAAAAEFIAELDGALAEASRANGAGRRRVFCPIWKNPWMSFNRDTYAHDLLWLAGGENVCADRTERYCAVRLDHVAGAQPEVILLPDEPYVFQKKDLPALAGLHGTPAWQAQRVHFIDGKALSWYGPRTAAALRSLRRILAA
jgi:ABC-type Fe3+-hydroxamate transport system substrate-binding protein